MQISQLSLDVVAPVQVLEALDEIVNVSHRRFAAKHTQSDRFSLSSAISTADGPPTRRTLVSHGGSKGVGHESKSAAPAVFSVDVAHGAFVGEFLHHPLGSDRRSQRAEGRDQDQQRTDDPVEHALTEP